MHAVGQQPTVETLFITVATHATMERTVVLYGVWSGTTMWKCFLLGPAQRLYKTRVFSEPVAVGSELRGQFQLRVIIRAEQRSSEKSCRVAGERILRYWKTGNQRRYSVKTRQVL
jgi:hypothetical protein